MYSTQTMQDINKNKPQQKIKSLMFQINSASCDSGTICNTYSRRFRADIFLVILRLHPKLDEKYLAFLRPITHNSLQPTFEKQPKFHNIYGIEYEFKVSRIMPL